MKRYKKYKNSGIPWLGEIPEHWKVLKIKYRDKVIMGQSPDSKDYNMNQCGIPFLQGNADFGYKHPDPKIWCETSNKIAEKNDILLSVRAPIGAVNIANQRYGIGRGLCSIRSIRNSYKFLYYHFLTRNPELNSIGTGSTYTAISSDEVNNLIITFPSLNEQTAIANYLDRKTSLIDDLIAKKKRMVELLNEEKTSIINEAVTKGLDPNSPMKDSQIPWIGEIPEHWEVIKLKYRDKVIMGQSPNSKDYNINQCGMPFLQGNADFGYIHPDPKIWCETSNKIAEKNDILLSVRAPIGSVNIANQRYGIGRGLCSIRSIRTSYKFLYYHFLTRNPELNSIGTGSTYTAISSDEVNNLIIPFPSLREQTVISNYLDQKISQIEESKNRINREIVLLEEYRTSLISEVVTGKIDVRGEN